MKNVAAVILAAGKGTRMKSEYPKVVHSVCGLPLISHVIRQIKSSGIKKIIVVVGHGKEHVIKAVENENVEIIEQKEQLGTGHALMVCKKKLTGLKGHLLVLPGDAFIENTRVIKDFCKFHLKSKLSMSVLSNILDNPYGYGRIIRSDSADNLIAIREELDASKQEKAIREINTGIYLFSLNNIFKYLENVGKNQKKKEYYLTDVVDIYSQKKVKINAFNLNGTSSVLGVNDRTQLADIHNILKRIIIEKHQLNGVTVLEPDNTYIEVDVKIGMDSTVYPYSYIENNVKIGKACNIGPFCKIRTGTTVKNNSNIGSFVEIVRSQIGSKTNIKHLSYIGDASIGNFVNVGAGTITANYDGKSKNKTTIHDNVLLGSDTVLIAPVSLGKGSKTGAGAVVTKGYNVPKGKTAVGMPAKV